MDGGKQSPARILLYRHGETVEGCFERCCAGSDIDLSPAGIETSLQIVRQFLRQQVRLVVTSPLRRASFVGKISQRRHGIPHEPLPDLRERHLGQWEKKRWADIAAQHGQLLLHAFQERPHMTDIPDAEDPLAFQDRVERGWNALVENARRGGPVGVVGHYVWSRAALEELLGFTGIAQNLHPGGLCEIDASGKKPSLVRFSPRLELHREV